MPLQNATTGSDRTYMILRGTEGYFSALDDVDKRSEKRTKKINQRRKVFKIKLIKLITLYMLK